MIDIVVSEVDNPLRTGTHAGTATTTAGRIGQWSAFLIIIKCAERTLFSTAFALGASLQEEIRIGCIAGTRMNGYTAIGGLNALNSFQRRAGRVVDGLFHRFGFAHTTTGINTGPACFIRKADKMRIRIAIKQIQIKKGRSLTIGQVDRIFDERWSAPCQRPERPCPRPAVRFSPSRVSSAVNHADAASISSTFMTAALVMKMPSLALHSL